MIGSIHSLEHKFARVNQHNICCLVTRNELFLVVNVNNFSSLRVQQKSGGLLETFMSNESSLQAFQKLVEKNADVLDSQTPPSSQNVTLTPMDEVGKCYLYSSSITARSPLTLSLFCCAPSAFSLTFSPSTSTHAYRCVA